VRHRHWPVIRRQDCSSESVRSSSALVSRRASNLDVAC
jgi:hypothetical protein